MSNFKDYAKYYDLIYRDKNYRAEAEYVATLIRSCAPEANKVLNIGCGTGKHDYILAEMGYQITGADLSDDMVSQAMQNRPVALQSSLSFIQGDFRSLDLKKTFDVVLSLFHVVSYQHTNNDLLQAFASARRHLPAGGFFIFDFWYGPGVLTDPPTLRVREFFGEGFSFTRTSRPLVHSRENTVDVEFTLDINHEDGKPTQIKENHLMRYFFLPELRFYLQQSGFAFLAAKAWMEESTPELHTWNAVVIAKAV